GYVVCRVPAGRALGRRLAPLARRTGAVTVPDLFRARFGSPTLGLVASLLILFYLSFMMVAQFKAGALIMKISWPGSGALALAEDAAGGIDRAYYLGLVLFTVVVVGYTVIGGVPSGRPTRLFPSRVVLAGGVGPPPP